MTSPNTNLAEITAFLRGKGEGAAQIAAIEGNMQVESGFSPTAYNANENAIGIAQWELGRKVNLDRYAAQTGGSEASLQTQLGYFWQEATGPYKSVLDQINSSNDVATDAAVWDSGYEGSLGTTRSQRVSAAQSLYQQLVSGGVPTVVTPGAGSGSGSGSSATPAGDITTQSVNWIKGGFDLLTGNLPGTIGDLFGGASSSVAGKITSGLVNLLLPFVIQGAFLAGGLALVVLGLYSAAQPVREDAQQAVQSAAPLIAAAA